MLFLRHEPTEKLREDELSILLLATQKLGLPAETRSLCFYFYHRLFFIEKECRNITRFATVVNLSMKINENVRKFKEIFTVISEILQEKHEFIKIKDEMMILELILQENTGFLLEFDSPFKFLILILKDLNLPKEIGKKSWKITQYSLFSPVILQIVPHAVAFSAIYISVILSNEKGNLSVKMLEKYYLSQDQVFKGVTGILKLLLNKKIQENFKIGENQDLILKILNSVETKGLVDTGFLLHSNKSPYPRQNMGHNHGYGQNQYHGYGHGNAQSHGRPNHVGFGERRPAHTPAPVIHTGYSGNMLSSSGPGHASVPDKRKHSDQYDKRDSRGDSRSGDYDRRQKCSSTDSYSDDSYDRDHDKNYRSSRDERDAYHGRGGDYERKSDRRDDKNHVGSGERREKGISMTINCKFNFLRKRRKEKFYRAWRNGTSSSYSCSSHSYRIFRQHAFKFGTGLC
jgi:hypothetical protein